MINKETIKRYCLGIYFILLSLPIFSILNGMFWGLLTTMDHALSVTRRGFLTYFIVFVFPFTIGCGVILRQTWALFLAKYVYPPVAIVVVLYASLVLTILSLVPNKLILILVGASYFNVLFLIYVLPVLFYFYSNAILKFRFSLKIILLILGLGPVSISCLSFYIIPYCQELKRSLTQYPIKIEGTIVDFDSQKPVADAKICVSNASNLMCTQSKEDGSFRLKSSFRKNTPEVYIVSVRKEGYVDNSQFEHYPPEQKKRIIKLFEKEKDIILPQGISVRFSGLLNENRTTLYFRFGSHFPFDQFVPTEKEADLILVWTKKPDAGEEPGEDHLFFSGEYYLKEIKAAPGGGIKPVIFNQEGVRKFEEITACGTNNYQHSILMPQKNGFDTSFCVRTREGYYAKINIFDQIVWVLQPDMTDNLRTKDVGFRHFERSQGDIR